MFPTPSARNLAVASILFAVLLVAGCARDIHDTTLDNGMRVIVKEDHRSPVVVTMVWYRVGSMDEPKGLTGISHVLEHMMFKGTEKLKPNEFSRIIAEHGGRENAFTSYDYTAYFQQLEKSRLPISFELEADRMRNLKLDPEEVRKEVQVVMEERRLRTEDQPEALTYEQFMNQAYQVHPYRHPVIGWMEDLGRITPEDLRAWYERWYTPNNATLVVVGDVKPKEVVALAKRHFGPIPKRAVDRPPVPREPPQIEPRRTTVKAPAQVPYLLLGFHVPVHQPDGQRPKGQAPWEPYALSVLTGVLDGGDSARFERELIREERIAAGISTQYSSISRSPTMLLFGGTPAADRTPEELEAALRAQIHRLRKEPVSEAELKRVKAQVVAGDVYARDSVFYQAMELGRLAMADLDLDLIEERVERFNAVTPEQVMEVARKYLTEENSTTAVLEPMRSTAGRDAPRPAARQGVGHAR
ncbi:peptidase M16 [Sulfurifustis variabilis]|uniref:Peptidase M16 n=1 Tax=Sulfurifustis variabilis TaxID=1675686 RepID=A0A1B4V1B7_9GAMM|nr:pitrilysin family protein [Sulfurifustis variabilis]BAU47065.1 peptidase M16 [Sulfurifustis variabilis]